MDTYLAAVRSHLKLVDKVLSARLAHEVGRPKGNILRNNKITHTRALIALVDEVRIIADHDPDEWWDEADSVPF